MKNKLIALVLMGVSFVASAQTSTTGDTTAGISGTSSSQSTQQSNVSNQVVLGSGGAYTYGGEYTVKSAPTVYAPNLTTGGLETCLGSVSAGGSFLGGGFSVGTTLPDTECNVRMTANVAWKMGQKDLAVAVMCESDVFAKAAARMPQDPCAPYRDKTTQPAQAAVQGEPQDPYVRARIGLPPLASK